ncbi:MAG: 5-azacytidine-induced 1 [Trebouxia sp. A1-2]|nr:MAG: 5-azacytidine-induced 1 [Trebouxia sp. A1-2]
MTIAIGLAEYRESVQQFEVQSVKPPGAAVRADSPVHGLDALLPALPQQGCESAAVRIQRWYRHKQAERQAAQQDVRDFVQQRRHATGVHTAEGNEDSISYADREALAAAAVAKAARLATQKQVACFHRDLREGLKQASKAAEEHHTEQPGPDQHQLQSDVSQQDWVPAITLSVSPRQSQQSGQGVIAADNSKLIGLPLLRATSPPQMLSRSAAADRITVSVPQLEASFSGRQDSDMPLAEADFSKAQDMTCALDCRGHQLHVDQDAMLSSALFDDFTREVAARIIQHYWREYVSTQAAAQNQYSGATEHQDHNSVDESQRQGHGTRLNPGNEEAVPELIQDDSLRELLMRYRSDAGRASEQQQAQAQAAELSLGARACRLQTAPVALQTVKLDDGKAGDIKRDGLLPIAADDTAASSSSLDRLKARHSKHRRPAQLTADTAKSVAQHALVQQASGAWQSKTGPMRLTDATEAAAADLSLHQARFAMPNTRKTSTAGTTAVEDKVQLSTTSPTCEDSDSAVFDLLNQSPQGPAYMSVSAAAPQPVSHSGRQQHQQQQQQTQGMDNVRGSDSEFQEGCDENASPNVSPIKGQAKPHKQQQRQQEAAWHRAPDPARMTVLKGGSQRDKPSASATAAALHVGADDPASASELQPVADMQTVAKRHGDLSRSERQLTDKLADIFAFLDDVEAQAEEEAARVLSQASTPSHHQPIKVQGYAQQPCCQGHVLQPSQACPSDSCSRASSLAQPRQQQTQQSQGQFQHGRAHVSQHRPSSGGLPAGKPVLDSMLGAASAATRALPSRHVEEMPGARAEFADTTSSVDNFASTLQCALDEQKKKLEGDMARHLAFIDRLLADKDKLSAKCMQLGKDMKGMEPEIQRLIAKHKAELQSERDKAQDHTRLQLDDLTGQHETYARQLRDRLLREQDLAVERERAAAQDRLREAAERYEGQMQSQRLRMVSDSELRLEQFQAERKDEKRRYEDALDRVKQGQGEQEQQLRSELSLEKAQLRRQHERELQALRDKIADEQEGWRLAVAKRAKEELASREAALRTQLMQERDHQLQVVVERLETEAADNREAATKEADKQETALKGRYQAALQAAQDSEHKHAERFRVAGQAEAAAQQRSEQLQSQVAHLQQHLQDQRSGLADAKQKASSLCSFQDLHQVSELRQRQTQELKQVQLRVQTAVAAKDETIAALTEQLSQTLEQLKSTEAVLQQQQAELC